MLAVVRCTHHAPAFARIAARSTSTFRVMTWAMVSAVAESSAYRTRRGRLAADLLQDGALALRLIDVRHPWLREEPGSRQITR